MTHLLGALRRVDGAERAAKPPVSLVTLSAAKGLENCPVRFFAALKMTGFDRSRSCLPITLIICQPGRVGNGPRRRISRQGCQQRSDYAENANCSAGTATAEPDLV
jgi:hypothetical protein